MPALGPEVPALGQTAATPLTPRLLQHGRGRGGHAALATALLSLQRTAGNAAVARLLARSVSPPPPPGAALPTELAQLDPMVQQVLHRRGHARVSRPRGGWVVSQATDEYIDFDWTALLFVLHRADAASGAADYFTVLDRLMIPALRGAAADPTGTTLTNLPNLDPLTAGMWARHPPSYITRDRTLNARWQQDLTAAGVEGLLTEAGTRAPGEHHRPQHPRAARSGLRVHHGRSRGGPVAQRVLPHRS